MVSKQQRVLSTGHKPNSHLAVAAATRWQRAVPTLVRRVANGCGGGFDCQSLHACQGGLFFRLYDRNHLPNSSSKFLCRLQYAIRGLVMGLSSSPSVALQGFYEIWGEGSTWEELQESIEAYPHSRKQPFYRAELTWKIQVCSWGEAISIEEQVKLVNRLAYVPLQVQVTADLGPTCLLLMISI